MKYVYSFNEGNKDMRNILGGKGANLCEMTNIGLPVPKGFIISTQACNSYYNNGKKVDKEIINQINKKLEELEEKTNKKFNDIKNPLLISVRSGARASMPGMMDTILNLGLNDKIVENCFNDNKRFIYDSYRRFIMMYADVVNGYDKKEFEKILKTVKIKKGVKYDTDLDEKDMKVVVEKYKKLYKFLSGKEFPQDPKKQLIEAVKAVFNSWDNERANVYRMMNNIPYSWGTAVNIQEMVYGNLNINSGSGVAFSRNPVNGENELYGEYLINAQGEDVVSGVRTPKEINTLKELMPKVYEEFYKYAKKLEKHYKDMQDMEFTIEDGKLYILQTRNAKRTAMSAIKVAVDMVKEKLITQKQAILMVDSNSLDQLLHKTFDQKELSKNKPITKGIPSSPGAGFGKIFFDSKSLAQSKEKDKILVRLETSPEDITGMKQSNGILTVTGGSTSHAAVVARAMGVCCISGASNIIIDEKNKLMKIGNKIIKEKDYVSLDGTTGNVYLGKINIVDFKIDENLKEFMTWVDRYSKLIVRANADTKEDAILSKSLGAKGIGLIRTEHMFFDKNRILNFRKMIISKSIEERKKALSKILPYQMKDFEDIFTVMDNEKVVIRYLDPPLHEFLPKDKQEIKELSRQLKLSVKEIEERINSLKEFNPMMGHRGIRLSITYPDIAIMQTDAIIKALINVKKKGINPEINIMIPLVVDEKEFIYIKNIIEKEIELLSKKENIKLDYKIGTMIESPRAALISDKLAKHADFFSYGTNDLTQLTYGFSRDDSPKFLNDYYDKKIFEIDPFKTIDDKGVLKLVEYSIKEARKVNKKIELGVCGEHAGDKDSIYNFNNIGLNYVSASPYRIMSAKLSSAQANINNK